MTSVICIYKSLCMCTTGSLYLQKVITYYSYTVLYFAHRHHTICYHKRIGHISDRVDKTSKQEEKTKYERIYLMNVAISQAEGV